MRKPFRVLAVVLLCCLLFAACDKQETPQTSQDAFAGYTAGDESGGTVENIAVSASVQNNDTMRFAYTGEPIAIDYAFSASDSCRMGLLIFMNGILQSYQVDGQTTVMHSVNLKAEEEQVFTLYLTPTVGKAGDEVQLNFVNVFDPSLKTAQADGAVVFGNSHKFSQPLPWSVEMQADAKSDSPQISTNAEIVAMTDEQIQGYLQTDSRGNTRDKRDALQFEITADGQDMAPCYSLQAQNNIELRLYGNTAQTYRVCLLADFTTLLPINGAQFVDVAVQKDSYSVVQFSIERNTLEPYTNLFAVAVALDSEDGVYKTSSICLIK